MRTYNHLYENEKQLKEFFDNIAIYDSEEVLIRVHSSVHSKEQIEKVVHSLKMLVPKAHIIGCSVVRVIKEGKLYADSCLISVSVFDNAHINTAHFSCYDENKNFKSGEQLGKEIMADLLSDKEYFMLTFFPSTYSKIEDFIDYINKSEISIKMLGGGSYFEDKDGNVRPELKYVLDNENVLTEEIVIAYIEAPELYVYGDYVCGVEAVGRKSHIVSDGNIITKIDDINAADWYGSQLGEEELIENPQLAHVFPIVKKDTREMAYYVDYIKQDERYVLSALPDFKSGDNVSIGYFNPEKIFYELREVRRNINACPAETIFAYVCQARKNLLNNCAKWEIRNFNTTNISGALLSGEIASRNGENLYANYTFVFSVLSENSDSRFSLGELDIKSINELQQDNVQMLNYLFHSANRHLSEELQQQQSKMQNAVFYNAAVGINNQLKYLFDKENECLNKKAIFSLNNEKILKLFSGVTQTYGYLRECYAKAMAEFGRDGLYMYSYNDTSLFIAANESISEDEFVEIADKIHEFLNNTSYDGIHVSYTSVIIFGIEDSIYRLETAIEYAKQHNTNKICFDDVGNDVKNQQEDLHMLWIIREAIVHKRVVPFFQEIHDNKCGKKRMFESLMRISDADGKIYYPDSFLPVAKEYNLYNTLSELMVKTVIDMFIDKDICVSINLSVQDIYNRDMIQMIFNKIAIAKHPENFVFEIVESDEIKDYEYIKAFAERIHECGGKIAIDDFGSGFSNLLSVINVCADFIKIDGEIVKSIAEDARCCDFVEFINGWCERAGQKVICEYVENKEIQRIMESIGVGYSQGYYFSKPHQWSENDEQLIS